MLRLDCAVFQRLQHVLRDRVDSKVFVSELLQIQSRSSSEKVDDNDDDDDLQIMRFQNHLIHVLLSFVLIVEQIIRSSSQSVELFRDLSRAIDDVKVESREKFGSSSLSSREKLRRHEVLEIFVI